MWCGLLCVKPLMWTLQHPMWNMTIDMSNASKSSNTQICLSTSSNFVAAINDKRRCYSVRSETQ